MVAEGAMVAIEAGVEDCKDLGTSFDACFFESGSWGDSEERAQNYPKSCKPSPSANLALGFSFWCDDGCGACGASGASAAWGPSHA